MGYGTVLTYKKKVFHTSKTSKDRLQYKLQYDIINYLICEIYIG